jgi:hypothetical protein
MKAFAQTFYKKFQEIQMKENKAWWLAYMGPSQKEYRVIRLVQA